MMKVSLNWLKDYLKLDNYSDEERFFFAPFLIGGLAGTALGYGIANNNQINNGYYQPYPIYPVYPTFD